MSFPGNCMYLCLSGFIPDHCMFELLVIVLIVSNASSSEGHGVVTPFWTFQQPSTKTFMTDAWLFLMTKTMNQINQEQIF